MQTLWSWIKKHYMFSIFLGILFIVTIFPFIIQVAVVTPSIFANSGNNDWIGFWGGYLGAIVGASATLLGILISNAESRRQMKQSNEVTMQQMHDQIKADRALLIEQKRIEYSPYFTVEKFLPSQQELQNIGYKRIIYSFTEKQSHKYPIGLSIRNISKVYALDLFVCPYDKNNIWHGIPAEVKIIQPDETVNLIVFFNYVADIVYSIVDPRISYD